MSIKQKIQNMLPSYRSKDAIMDELYNIHSKIDKLDRNIKDLDVKNEYLFYCLQHLDSETELETKKRVYLNMPKASGQIRDFQIVANYILRKVKKICEESEIAFSISGGTLLGAIRHAGFIPWDDDVDICVIHEDYYRLEEAVNRDEELVMRRYYRYLEEGTKASYVTKIKLRSSDLFFIDVFPRNIIIDQHKNVDDVWREIQEKERQFKEELNIVFSDNRFEHIPDDKRPRHSSILDQPIEQLEKKYQNYFSERNKKRKGVQYCCLGIETDHSFFKKEMLNPSCIYLPFRKNMCEFEGDQYPCFNDWNKWLELWFGNYWSLPQSVNQVHSSELKHFSAEDYKIVEKIKRLYGLDNL